MRFETPHDREHHAPDRRHHAEQLRRDVEARAGEGAAGAVGVAPAGGDREALGAARDRGAQLIFVGVVHKSSTLILQLWARLVDARTGRDIMTRDLNFRGDTDESWQRAEAFLVAQIRDAAAKPL